MKKIIFLLTFLSIINNEAFASQPQSTKPTSSWLSWVPYAAGTALIGTGLGAHFYNKYAQLHSSEKKKLKQRSITLQAKIHQLAVCLDDESQLNKIHRSVQSLPKSSQADKGQSLQTFQTAMHQLKATDRTDYFKFSQRFFENHINNCSQCSQQNNCTVLNAEMDATQKFAESQKDTITTKKIELQKDIHTLNTKLQPSRNYVASLATKKSIAYWTTFGSWLSFGSFAGVGVYSWLARK